MSDPTRLRRVLLEDDAEAGAPVPLPSTEDTALRRALGPIVEKIAAGELEGDEAVSALVTAMADPEQADTERQTALAESESRERHARRRHGREVLESAARGTGVTITESMLNVCGGLKSASDREAKAEELIAAARARTARPARSGGRAADAADALGTLMDG